MRVAVGSAHRNSSGRTLVYLRQVAELRDKLAQSGVDLRVIAVEGDSRDDTRGVLLAGAEKRGLELDLVTCDHGGPEFGSTEAPERMRALSKVGNAILDSVREDDAALFYVESDLIWDADTAERLIWLAINHASRFDVFAPMVMAGTAFYDIWGFRGLDGRRFSSLTPFYPGLLESEFFEVGSAGSCLAIPGTVARKARIRDENCLVGWCADARRFGYRICCIPNLSVNQV
jgi:hypothetical protein